MRTSRIFTFLSVLLLGAVVYSTSNAEIVHIDYGNDFVVEMGANHAVDIDGNGSNDFVINSTDDELAIKTLIGCFSKGEYYGSGQSVRVYEGGEAIGDGDDEFEDFGNGRMYSTTDGYAPGWENDQWNYIGIMFFDTGNMGWMRIKINAEEETVTIKEVAWYDDGEAIPAGEGSTFRQSPLAILDQAIRLDVPRTEQGQDYRAKAGFGSVTVSPNPVAEVANITFEDQSALAKTIEIFDASGKQLVAHQYAAGHQEVQLQQHVSDWNSGLYIVRLSNSQGVIDQTKLMIP